MKGTIATVVVLVGLLAATVVVSLWAWQSLGEVQIGWHGYVALAVGAVGTLGLAAVLVALMMYSSRRGYDEGAHRHERRVLHRDDEEDRG